MPGIYFARAAGAGGEADGGGILLFFGEICEKMDENGLLAAETTEVP
ncbi:hypothetical protein I8J29_32890 [Paenibacillus sp. MWE-103]|uniref:Uncharacterized protein n=1 Tax=Paenibacillus artemisiicola TaxID=1172618 RepID=A0ABS3WKW0_9BACL|nr:hypothetical protein [Paenibacillus artemisiicola]MBO7748969.1 hypothetical protein [Paenibacillus artemisiicola]